MASACLWLQKHSLHSIEAGTFSGMNEYAAMSTVFLKRDELLAHFDVAGVTLRSLVQAVLRCTPVDRHGKHQQWPCGAHLTVGQLMERDVWAPQWERQVQGLLVMATLVAEDVVRACLFSTNRMDREVLINAEQRDEILEAVCTYLAGYEDETVQGVLHHQPSADGFFSSFVDSNPDKLEALLPNGGDKVRRILDEPFMDARLVVWRITRCQEAGVGERIHDTIALMLDERGRQAAYAQLRLAALPPVMTTSDWVAILDAYDALGLELGMALQQAATGRQLRGIASPETGLTVLQLQEIEVRADIRGQGLGMEMLKRVMPLAVRRLKHQPQVFALAAKPMQYDYPVGGMPPDMLLDALDAAENLAKYFQDQAPQETIASLTGSDILFLGVDERATGSYYQQLDALSEACPENEDG